MVSGGPVVGLSQSRLRRTAYGIPVVVLACFAMHAGVVAAAGLGPNLITNGDFESPTVAPAFVDLPNGSGSLSGWTTSGGGVEIIRTFWQPEHGSQSIDLSNAGPSQIEQQVPTIPRTDYQLSWYIAGNPNCTETQVRAMSVIWNGRDVDDATFDQRTFTAQSMGWAQESLDVESVGGTSTIAFARDVGAGGCGVAVDNVALESRNGSGAGSGSSSPGRSTIASSLPTPADAFSSLRSTAVNAVVAVAAILLITFPAQLFNRTFEDNYDQIVAFWERTLPFLKRTRAALTRGRDRVRSRAMVVLVVVVGAALGGFLDPSYGFNGRSLTTYLSLVLSTLWGIAVSTGALVAYRRFRDRDAEWTLRALPAGLVIAAGCVLVSRVTDFEPGYLYGVVCGAVFTGALASEEQGRAVAVATLGTVVIAFLAWFAWVPVNGAAAGPGAAAPLIVLDNFLGMVFTSGLIGATIGMVPVRFLPGGMLAAWNRWVWSAVTFVVTFAFIQVMLNPARGGHPGSAGLGTVIVLFVLFGGGSVYFAYHYRTKPALEAAAPSGPPRVQ